MYDKMRPNIVVKVYLKSPEKKVKYNQIQGKEKSKKKNENINL